MADRRYALIGHTHAGLGGSAWGSITGTLADQTDLQSALDLKATTSSLNISNWDTAYGWGNHASAGYATTASGTFDGAVTAGNDSNTRGEVLIYSDNQTSPLNDDGLSPGRLWLEGRASYNDWNIQPYQNNLYFWKSSSVVTSPVMALTTGGVLTTLDGGSSTNWNTAYAWRLDPTAHNFQGSTVANASTNADSIATTWSNHVSQWKSGAWDVNSATWMPATGWWWCGTFAHSNNTSSYNYAGQIAFQNNTTPTVYVRTISGGTPGSWHGVLTINPTGWVALANGKEYLDASDTYLRLNQNNDFTSGVYTPYNLRVDGSIYVGSANYLTSSSGIKLNTPSGYAEIGPQNGSYCHYVTDRATHWFNGPVEVDGSISDYNAGSARPYLHLTNTGMTSGGNVTFSTSAASGGASGDIWFKYT